jgi:hypothetical protein
MRVRLLVTLVYYQLQTILWVLFSKFAEKPSGKEVVGDAIGRGSKVLTQAVLFNTNVVWVCVTGEDSANNPLEVFFSVI